MSDFYPNEGERHHKICLALQEYGIHIYPGTIGASEQKTDGHVCTANCPILIQELKTEIGWKGAEPSLQALLYYCIFCDQYNLWDDDSTSHPCLVIFLAGQSELFLLSLISSNDQVGPHIGFAGCALTGCPTMEIFSLLPLNFHSTNDDAYDALARHLSAIE